MTWKGESRRHSLARKGIKTSKPMLSYGIDYKAFYDMDFKDRKKYLINQNPNYKILWDKLLSIGGKKIAYQPETDDELNKIINGEAIDGDIASLYRMETGNCHGNSCEYYLKMSKYAINSGLEEHGLSIMTGYALSEDGIWRQHTWIYDDWDNEITETTTLRTNYFGYKLEGDELDKFIAQNL